MSSDLPWLRRAPPRRRRSIAAPAGLITAADKVDALARLRAGGHSIPAGRISTANALVIADAATAGGAAR